MALSPRALRTGGLLAATGLTAVGLTFGAGVAAATAATPTIATPATTACTAVIDNEYEGYNQNCTYAQIWNTVNGSKIYGNRAAPRTYTEMGLCYANVSGYGLNKGTYTGAS